METTPTIITAIALIIAAIIGSPILVDMYRSRKERNDLTKLTYGKEVAIRVSDGTYLKVDHNNFGTLVGGSQEIGAWNVFTIVEAEPLPHTTRTIKNGDKVAFKAKVRCHPEFCVKISNKQASRDKDRNLAKDLTLVGRIA